jgi:hypothetical protein
VSEMSTDSLRSMDPQNPGWVANAVGTLGR